ncbi:MAG: hypothetical protein GX297_01680 [Treponema sp.]|nr:hypothetical protein [Treponema sp.]
MKQKSSLFSYKKGNSFLHKCPSWIKILFIPLINVLFLFLPYQFSLFSVICFFILAFILGISFNEQFTDIKPVFYYVALLFIFQLCSVFSTNTDSLFQNFVETFSWKNQKESILFLLKLISVMQSSSILFKTSTSLELREGISLIEQKIRIIFNLKNKNSFTEIIFIFLNFIPLIARIWLSLKKTWKARNGKIGIKMYIYLLPVLFFVSMKKAWNLSRAIFIRAEE